MTNFYSPEAMNCINYTSIYLEKNPVFFPLLNTGYGLVFEDDGDTGYLYVTDKAFKEIYDTLHVYNAKTISQPVAKENIYIVWNPKLLKAGLYYSGKFHAVVDLKNQEACCLSGFPKPHGTWCKSTHVWNKDVIKNLEISQL